MKNLFLFITFSATYYAAFTQTSKFPLGTPSEYSKPVDYEYLEENKTDKANAQNDYWIVYSDRNNNCTYNSSACSGTEKKKNIVFLEMFYVQEESENALRIIKDSRFDYDNGYSSMAVDYGWIPKKNVILWSHCLVTTNHIDKKAMVTNTIDYLRDGYTSETKDIVTATEDPSLKNKIKGASSRLYEIFYIFKFGKDAVLLSVSPNISNVNDPQKSIIGWFPKSRITFWNHRVAIEPNWDKVAADKRKQKDKLCRIFTKRDYANYYANGQLDKNEVVWERDTYEKRNIGEVMRFPLLQEFSDQTIKTGVMGDIQTDKGTMLHEEMAQVQRLLNIYKSKKENLNIIFVIDGTQSMELYIKGVALALDNSVNSIRKAYPYHILKFGSVVYRDAAEKERLYETCDLTPSTSTICRFLNNIEAKDIYDNDKHEAVYFGINKVFEEFQLNKEETNIIILIGDAGNHAQTNQTNIAQSIISQNISDYECSFLSIQVNNEDHIAYDDFVDQTKQILINAANMRFNKLSTNFLNLFKPSFIPNTNNKYELINNTSMFGKVIFADKGQRLSSQTMQSIVVEMANEVNKLNEYMLTFLDGAIKNGINGVDKKNGEFNATIIDFFRKSGFDEKTIKLILSDKSQVYLERYTVLNTKEFEEPLFKRVLMMNRDELVNLYTVFRDISYGNDATEQREKMVTAMKNILKKYSGPNEVEEDITIEEFNKKIYGVPSSKNGLLYNKTLNEILDEKAVSRQEFNKYHNKVKEASNILQDISNQKEYEYMFYSNHIPYYWIPEDILP